MIRLYSGDVSSEGSTRGFTDFGSFGGLGFWAWDSRLICAVGSLVGPSICRYARDSSEISHSSISESQNMLDVVFCSLFPEVLNP